MAPSRTNGRRRKGRSSRRNPGLLCFFPALEPAPPYPLRPSFPARNRSVSFGTPLEGAAVRDHQRDRSMRHGGPNAPGRGISRPSSALISWRRPELRKSSSPWGFSRPRLQSGTEEPPRRNTCIPPASPRRPSRAAWGVGWSHARGPPFYDVLTTKGQEWVADRLHNRATGRKPNRRHEVREEVRRLLEQRKSRAEISRMMGLSNSLCHTTRRSWRHDWSMKPRSCPYKENHA